MKLNLTKSLKMQERAKRLIPGMTQLLSKRPDMFSLGVWPGYFSKAKGVEELTRDTRKNAAANERNAEAIMKRCPIQSPMAPVG